MSITINQYLENVKKQAAKIKDAGRKRVVDERIFVINLANNAGVNGDNSFDYSKNFVSNFLKKDYSSLIKANKDAESLYKKMLYDYLCARRTCEKYYNDKGISFENAMKSTRNENENTLTIYYIGEALESINPLSKNAGKVFFERAREAYEKAQLQVMSNKVYNSYDKDTMGNAKLLLYSEIYRLRKHLDEGDETLRGSSREYKEIQRNLTELHDYIIKTRGIGMTETVRDRRIQLKMENIMEKAKKYIEDRREVELKYSEDSYKGKRVKFMKDVLATLDARSRCFVSEENCYVIGYNTAQELKDTIKNEFANEKFSAKRFAEIVLYNRIKENQEVYYRDIPRCIEDASHLYHIELMQKALAGKKVSYDKAAKLFKNAIDFIKKADDLIASKDLNKLREKAKLIDENRVDLDRSISGLAALDNMIYEKEVVHITGDSKLDLEVMNYVSKTIHSAIDELCIENNAPKNEMPANSIV